MNALSLPEWLMSEEGLKAKQHSKECKACIEFENWLKILGKAYYMSPNEQDKIWNREIKKWKNECPNWVVNRSHIGNGKPNGIFAGTLTMSDKDTTNENEMVIAIKKIMNQQTCPVEKYAWYLEYTKNGLPHIHFIYRTPEGTRIHQKVFKRYWKQWDEGTRAGAGFKGGYHRLAKSETAYLEYIAKDSGRHENKWTT